MHLTYILYYLWPLPSYITVKPTSRASSHPALNSSYTTIPTPCPDHTRVRSVFNTHTYLNCDLSSWGTKEELVEYLGVVVFIPGQTVAYALHLLPLENILLTLPSALTANTHPSALNAATETLSFLQNRTLTVSHTNLEAQVRRH